MMSTQPFGSPPTEADRVSTTPQTRTAVNGDAAPYGIQDLLGRALWQADQLRDALYDYGVAHLGKADAVPVVDETGFLKKVTRQPGLPGSTTAQPARSTTVILACLWPAPSRLGQTLLDRALYLPASWKGHVCLRGVVAR